MVNNLNLLINQVWNKNVKQTKITRHSKQWWTDKCKKTINEYRTLRSLENWKTFKKVINDTKRSFFDSRIWEIANKSHSSQELMNWVSKHKLSATKAIKYEGQPCITPESLWGALHTTFNTTLHCQIDIEVLNKTGSKPTLNWILFLKEKFRQALVKYNNSSAPGSDKLTWCHLKAILKQDTCLAHITNIVDICINLGH